MKIQAVFPSISRAPATVPLIMPVLFLFILTRPSSGQFNVWTADPDSVTSTSAVLRMYVHAGGGEVSSVFRYGIQWPNQSFLPAGSWSGSTVNEVRVRIGNLIPNSLYACMAQVTRHGSVDSTVYGGVTRFRTSPDSAHGGFMNHLTFYSGTESIFSAEMSFGVHTLASSCCDLHLGEMWMPPEPPQGGADFRFVDPRGFNPACMDLGILPDVRRYESHTQVDTYQVRCRPGNPGYPLKIKWSDVSKSYGGDVRLLDALTGGIINVDMKNEDSVMIHDPITQFLIIAEQPIHSILPTTVMQEGQEHRSFSLGQNYPNPFGETSLSGKSITTIRFAIPSPVVSSPERTDNGELLNTHTDGRMTTLRVYDLLGREVATLVNEDLPSGTHETTFSGSNMASGVYFYRLESGSFLQTRKLILMR